MVYGHSVGSEYDASLEIEPLLDPYSGTGVFLNGREIDPKDSRLERLLDYRGEPSLADVPRMVLDVELNDLGSKLLSEAEVSDLKRRINRALDDAKKRYNPKPAYKVRKQGSECKRDGIHIRYIPEA